MTRDRQRTIARTIARGAAVVLALSVAILVTDYVRARIAITRDDRAIAALQVRAQSDASFAAPLADEQRRITNTRQARKRRDDLIAIVAIAAAAAFIGAAKWRGALDGPRPRRLPLCAIRIEVATTGPNGHTSVPATASLTIDVAPVDAMVARHGRTREAAIPLLQAIQTHYGFLPDEALHRVCELTDVTPSQIAGTSSFYAHFRRSPVGDHIVRVCHGTACHVSGARQITEELRRHLRMADGADTDPERRFTIDEVACLGCCSLAPVVMVDDQTAGRLTPATAVAALGLAQEAEPV